MHACLTTATIFMYMQTSIYMCAREVVLRMHTQLVFSFKFLNDQSAVLIGFIGPIEYKLMIRNNLFRAII